MKNSHILSISIIALIISFSSFLKTRGMGKITFTEPTISSAHDNPEHFGQQLLAMNPQYNHDSGYCKRVSQELNKWHVKEMGKTFFKTAATNIDNAADLFSIDLVYMNKLNEKGYNEIFESCRYNKLYSKDNFDNSIYDYFGPFNIDQENKIKFVIARLLVLDEKSEDFLCTIPPFLYTFNTETKDEDCFSYPTTLFSAQPLGLAKHFEEDTIDMLDKKVFSTQTSYKNFLKYNLETILENRDINYVHHHNHYNTFIFSYDEEKKSLYKTTVFVSPQLRLKNKAHGYYIDGPFLPIMPIEKQPEDNTLNRSSLAAFISTGILPQPGKNCGFVIPTRTKSEPKSTLEPLEDSLHVNEKPVQRKKSDLGKHCISEKFSEESKKNNISTKTEHGASPKFTNNNKQPSSWSRFFSFSFWHRCALFTFMPRWLNSFFLFRNGPWV